MNVISTPVLQSWLGQIPSVLISIAKFPMVAAVAVDAAKTAPRTDARLLTQKGVDKMGEDPVRIVPLMGIRRNAKPGVALMREQRQEAEAKKLAAQEAAAAAGKA